MSGEEREESEIMKEREIEGEGRKQEWAKGNLPNEVESTLRCNSFSQQCLASSRSSVEQNT